PWVSDHKVAVALAVVVVLTAINLRGVRESGTAFAIPTYGFMIGIVGMVGWGLIRAATGAHLRAESAGFHLKPEHTFAGFALAFLVLRAFSSGSAALTGVEAISNGVPAFRKPKSRNAATTLLMMGLIAVGMLIGIIALAKITHLRIADDPGRQLLGTPHGYHQETAIAQLAKAVFWGHFNIGFYYVTTVTALILMLAANTAFNGFPVLGSILAQDRYLPRQLHTRGDRLAFSNGILFLALFACVLITAFHAEVTRLIQLYIVGVFVSFTCSQTGMVRHWNRLLRTERDQATRRRMRRSQAINTFGACLTGVVLVVVLITKFVKGAWIAIAAMAVIFLLMKGIRRHYDRVRAELAPSEEHMVLPARVHAIVLASKVHLPTMRALAYARATRPDSLTAVTVHVDDADTRALQADWERWEVPVPLTVIESPYREITKPILGYVKQIRRQSPRDVVAVYIPEYVVGRWWENLLHNQSALRLKTRLLFQPGVMVISVPYQLASSQTRAKTPDRPGAGAVRRGVRRPDAAHRSAAKKADKPGKTEKTTSGTG
ncbi:MAG: APC family permease, partial [Mycobacteriales bacterium]